jgi:hypothetical protein
MGLDYQHPDKPRFLQLCGDDGSESAFKEVLWKNVNKSKKNVVSDSTLVLIYGALQTAQSLHSNPD